MKSAGRARGNGSKGAEPSQINEAKFIRDFLNIASEERLDYSIIEAFDAPWKRVIEGTVGAHWGLWDASRQPKFPMSGSVVESTRWLQGYLISSLLGFAANPMVRAAQAQLKFAGQLFYAALIQAVASVFVWAIMAAMAERIHQRRHRRLDSAARRAGCVAGAASGGRI